MRIVRATGIDLVGDDVAARHLAVTCEKDGRTHYVNDVVYARGLTDAACEVIGLCGHSLVVGALVAPPGPACALCRAVLPMARAVEAK